MKVQRKTKWINFIGFSLFAVFCAAQNSETMNYMPLEEFNMSVLSMQSTYKHKTNLPESYSQLFSISRQEMPIFCKWELDIMDKTNIPIKFRLGDVEYVDRLELKYNH